MPFRISDAPTSSTVARQISNARNRITDAQEEIATGKRINRPSDDPQGKAAVINLRTSQAEIEQMKRNAGAAGDSLQATDTALDSYENMLDRAHAIMMQGASDLTTDVARQALAVDLDNLRSQVLSIANTRREGLYVFGGTRQNAPPFDPITAAPAATASTERLLRIEPGATPVNVGFRAEDIFSDSAGSIFTTLSSVSAALKGTGDPIADKAAILAGMDRLAVFTTQASVTRARVGPNLNVVEAAQQRLADSSFSTEKMAQRLEAADFSESAVKLSESQTALQAIVQTRGLSNRRSLIDYLG